MNRINKTLLLLVLSLFTIQQKVFAGIFGDLNTHLTSQQTEVATLWDTLSGYLMFACLAVGAGIFMFTKKGDTSSARSWGVGLFVGSVLIYISKQYI